MLLLFLGLASAQIDFSFPFNCSDYACNSVSIGNSKCDLDCMTPSCNYDSSDTDSDNFIRRFQSSDCFTKCIQKGCNPGQLGDGTCQSSCNFAECGFDLGDCGYCSNGCTKAMLTNRIPDSVCNVKACMYDNNIYGWCALGCFYESLWSSTCISACSNTDCNYQEGVCNSAFCAPGCSPSNFGDEICQPECNNAACSYDNWKCACSKDCSPAQQADTSTCYAACGTAECTFQNYHCGDCAKGCFSNMKGNGVCNTECNNEDCEYDWGDCQCAPGCNSKYINGAWTWDSNVCNPYCLVEDCLYNYAVCTDGFLIRAAFLYQLDNSNMNAVYNSTDCYLSPSTCTDAKLRVIDSSGVCDNSCKSSDCLYCMGYQKQKNPYLRYESDTVLICQANVHQIYSLCSNSICPTGFSSLASLDAIFGTSVCLRSPSSSSPTNYKTLYVDKSGTIAGTGTISSPFNSLEKALHQIIDKYTKITINPGTYQLKRENVDPTSLVVDSSSPLGTSVDLQLIELWIIGSSAVDRPIIQTTTATVIFANSAKRFYIKNVIFDGSLSMINNCNSDICKYCPYLAQNQEYFTNDKSQFLPNSNGYGTTCNENSGIDFITINDGDTLIMDTVDITYFQQQYNSFIKSSGSISLINVKFNRIQARKQSAFIQITKSADNTNPSFNFTTGSVTNLNYGYEHRSDIELSGFISFDSADNILFNGVTFNNNMAITGSSVSGNSYFIYLKDSIGSINFTSCTFTQNFVSALIYVDSQSLSYHKYTVEADGKLTQYSQNHLFIDGCTFNKIASLVCVICHKMATVLQNVQITKTTFTEIVSDGDGVLVISNTKDLTTEEKSGSWTYIQSGSDYLKAWISPRTIVLNTVTFTNIYHGGSLIAITLHSGISLIGVTVATVSNFTYLDMNNKVILSGSKLNAYITEGITSGKLSQNLPKYLISILNSLSLVVNTTSISSIYYGSAYPGLYLSSVQTISFNKLSLMNIQATVDTSILHITVFKSVNISDTSASSLIAESGAVLYVISGTNVTISNFTGYNLKSKFKPVWLLSTIQSAVVYNFSCSSCTSELGNGGALYILPTTQASAININKFVCTYCAATSGYGGGMFFDSFSVDLMHNFTVKNVEMSFCSANDGTAIYISDKFSIEQGYIVNATVYNSTSVQGAIISDNHKKGTLSLANIASKSNSAYYSVIKGSYSWGKLMLIMSNVTVTYSEAKAHVFLTSLQPGTSASISDLSISLSNSALAFDTYRISLSLAGISVSSGLGAQLTQAVILASNASFTYLTGSAFSGLSSSSISCTNCSFQHITSGPAIAIQSSSTISLQNSVFFNITSSSQAMAISMNTCTGLNTINNCSFIKSSSITGVLIDMQGSNLTITKSTVKENTSGAITAGIYVMTSILYVYSSNFSSQTGTSGSFIYLSTYSDASVIESTFTSGSASQGGAIASTMSSVSLKSSKFISNNANFQGGAIFSTTSSNLTINDCNFIENTGKESGSSISFSASNLQIYTSSFYVSAVSTASVINLDSATYFSMSGSSLQAKSQCSGITTIDTLAFQVTDSLLSYLSGGINAMAQNTTKTSVYQILNTKFINNTNTYGGGLAFSMISLLIDYCTFYGNTATAGGGMYFACSNTKCSFSISNTVFESNSAISEGGAIKWDDQKPTTLNVSYLNNSAAYGGNSASFPAKLSKSSSRSLAAIECQPGNICYATISIELRDSEGNLMALDNSSVASMESKNSSYSVSGNTKVTAVGGVFDFSSFTIGGEPNSYVNISIRTTAIDPLKASQVGDTESYSDSIDYLVYLRACQMGEQISSISCSNCTGQTYVMEAGHSCKNCPTGGNCTGGWKIYPVSGYWKSWQYGEVVYACPLAAACLGSTNDDDFTGTCEAGYIGKKCLGCDNGYSRSGSYKCGKCPSPTINAIIIVMLIFLVIGVGVVLVRSTLNSAYSPKALHSIYIKIFTNYIQLVFLTTQFELKWPYYVEQLFNAQKSVATASDQIFSLDCYFTDSGHTYEDTYYNKVLITAFLPPIIWFLSLLAWIGISLGKKRWSYLCKEYFTTMIVLFFLVYPNIVKLMFSVFSCTYIENEGFYMADNLVIKCWDSQHLKYSLAIALPSIIVWAIGVPTVVLAVLSKRRRFLNSDENRVIFGFLFNGYKQSRFFWEFVIMYRKILIICIAVFMKDLSSAIQALTLIILLIASLYMQYEFKPYNKRQLNHMETEAILTATITIYCGMYYLTEEIGDYFKTFLFICILIGNLYFIIYWLYYMFNAVIELLSGFVPLFRKLAGKVDPFAKYVSDEPTVLQGVIKDEDEGIFKFTLLKKEKKNLRPIVVENIHSLKDLFVDALRRAGNPEGESTIIEKEEDKDDSDEVVAEKYYDNDLTKIGRNDYD